MNFLFHHKTRKVLNAMWTVIAILIILGMVFFFAPGIVETLLF